jgi:hypothetical protein
MTLREEIEPILEEFFIRLGMDRPRNFSKILDYCEQDVAETADPIDWTDGDVIIALRRFLESRSPDGLIRYIVQYVDTEYERAASQFMDFMAEDKDHAFEQWMDALKGEQGVWSYEIFESVQSGVLATFPSDEDAS